MKAHLGWVLAGFVAVFSASTALAAPGAVHCGKLIDVRAGRALSDQVVVFDALGIITSVAAFSSTVLPVGMTVVDLSGATCLPGLIDVHTHLTHDPQYSGYKRLGVSVPQATVTGVKNARLTLMAGFTMVRNVGAKGFSDVGVRDGVNAGEIEGPRMLVSGPPLGITGGHCDDNLLAYEYHHTSEGVADGPWAAREKVRETIKYGADLIKICASGGVLSKGDLPTAPQYSLEEMQAIATEAHKLSRKVAAHAHGTQSIKDAIRAGIDSIEHSSLIDDEGIVLAKQHGTFLVFDIYNDDGRDPMKNTTLREFRKRFLDEIRSLHTDRHETQDFYERRYDELLAYESFECPLCEIDEQLIDAFRTWKQSQISRFGRTYSTVSLNRCLATLKRALRLAY